MRTANTELYCLRNVKTTTHNINAVQRLLGLLEHSIEGVELLLEQVHLLLVELDQLVQVLDLGLALIEANGQRLVRLLLLDDRLLVGLELGHCRIVLLLLRPFCLFKYKFLYSILSCPKNHPQKIVKKLIKKHIQNGLVHLRVCLVASLHADEAAGPVLHEMGLLLLDGLRFETRLDKRLLGRLRLLGLIQELRLAEGDLLAQLRLALLQLVDDHVLALLLHLELALVHLGLLGGASNDRDVAAYVLLGVAHVEEAHLDVVALQLQVAHLAHLVVGLLLIEPIGVARLIQAIFDQLARLTRLIELIVLALEQHLMLGQLLLQSVQLHAAIFSFTFRFLMLFFLFVNFLN